MKTVYKYGLALKDEQILQIPLVEAPLPFDESIISRNLLHVDTQHGEPQLWAMVDTDNPLMDCTICIRGTGHSCVGLDPSNYIGTVKIGGDMLIFHVFITKVEVSK